MGCGGFWKQIVKLKIKRISNKNIIILYKVKISYTLKYESNHYNLKDKSNRENENENNNLSNEI